MTLIACTINKLRPVLIGDILVTNKKGRGNSIHIPTALPEHSSIISELDFISIDLKQKIYILTDQLCVGFCGSVFQISNFLKQIKKYLNGLNDRKIIKADLEIFLRTTDLHENFYDLSFIFLLVTTNEDNIGNLDIAYSNTQDGFVFEEVQVFEKCYVGGSGKQDFLNEIKQSLSVHDAIVIDELHEALVNNLAFLGRLITKDNLNLQGYLNRWGAGFEFIFYDGLRFNKFQEYAFVVMQCYTEIDGILPEPVPTLVMHFKYQSTDSNASLEINTFNIHKAELMSLQNNIVLHHALDMHCNKFIIDSIENETINSTEYEHKDFKCNRLIIGYYIEKDGIAYYPSVFLESSLFFIEKKSENLYLSIDKSLMNRFKTEYNF